MKIRTGFVSNSSSASFIVEVKGEYKKLFNAMYENIPVFSTDGCIELLEKELKYLKEFRTPKEDADNGTKRMFEYEVKDLEKKIKDFTEYKEPDWYEVRKIEDKKEKELLEWRHRRHKEEVVRAVLNVKRWCISEIDDGYLSFASGGCTIYNGWENIRMHKDLLEILSFFTFMKYDVRTRIESQGSF